jgi:hypothetical protein
VKTVGKPYCFLFFINKREMSIMKKKILVLVVIMTMMLSLQTFALSESNLEHAYILVDEANSKINELILDAQEKAQEKPEEIQEIIDELIEETEEVSRETIEEGEELGVTIICEYVEVEINGVNVWIDPLLVVGW